MNKKEAIEIVKKNWPDSRYTMLREALQTLIPELCESDEEKIIKTLKEIVNWGCAKNISVDNNVELKDCLGWLEKQGEKIEPIEGFNTEFERQISHLIASTINKEYDYTKDFVKWTSGTLLNYAKHELEKQGRQKSQCKSAFELWKDMRLEVYQQASGNRHEPNCSDDSTKMFSLNDIDEIFEKVAENQGEQKVINEYNEHEPTSYEIEKWNEAYEKGYDIGYMNGKNEQKPTDAIAEMKQVEWSEEDEKLYNSALWHIKNSCGNGGKDSGEFEVYNWLKSLKDRVQPKQEWSEEDKSMYIRTLGILGKCYMGELPTEVEEELKWFKSITDKAQPQTNQYDKGYEDGYSAAKYNQWKPKKEELEALRKRTYFCEGIDANLDSLYTNLLKL